MKKLSTLLLLALLLASAHGAAAQTAQPLDTRDKGWWIGGEAGLWFNTEDGFTNKSFSIAPEVGYDINRHWAVGASVGYAWAKAEDEYGSVASDVFLLAPYARWKYCNAGRVTLFLDGGLGIAGGDLDGVKVGFQPGLSVRVGRRIRVLAHFGFLGYCTNYFNNGMEDTDGFGFRFSSSDLKFGFNYLF